MKINFNFRPTFSFMLSEEPPWKALLSFAAVVTQCNDFRCRLSEYVNKAFYVAHPCHSRFFNKANSYILCRIHLTKYAHFHIICGNYTKWVTRFCCWFPFPWVDCFLSLVDYKRKKTFGLLLIQHTFSESRKLFPN